MPIRRQIAASIIAALTLAALTLHLVATAVPLEADEIVAQLTAIHLDKAQVFSVRDITIQRDVFSISFNRGVLAFTEPVNGRVTGAVFIGSGDVLAILPDRVEKQQLHRYTKSAVLNDRFGTAVLRFTDDTFAEILKARRGRAAEDVDLEDLREVLRWESELQRRARYLNDRILVDLLGGGSSPLFLAQIEGEDLGWFDAIYDERRSEEVVIEQGVAGAAIPRVWASFRKRTNADGEIAAAANDKSPVDFVSYAVEGPVAVLKLRARSDGERAIRILSAAAGEVVSVAQQDGGDLSYIASGNHITVILPEPARRGREIALRVTYAGVPPAESGFPANKADSVAPATYRDQWIVEGLGHYAAAFGSGSLGYSRSRLLEQSPEGGSYGSLGPVSIGYRLGQLETTEAYANVLRDKSIWIVHMLRMVMRRGQTGDGAFSEMMSEFVTVFSGRTISTAEFHRLAEKHAGEDLDWFFDQWVYGNGIPAYRLDYRISPVGGGFSVEGRIEQSAVPASFTMPVPVYADETLLGRVTVSGDEGAFRFVVKNKPQQVLLDPQGEVLSAPGQ